MEIQPTDLMSISNSPQQRQISASATATSAAFAANLADKIATSQAASVRTTEETKGGGTYDFTNISPNNMLNTINSLIKSGQMSLDESSSLIAMMPISPLAGANFGSGKSDAANQPMNFFSSLERMIAFNKYIHNDAAVIYDQKALSALERFQGAPSAGLLQKVTQADYFKR
jgi:hypothetical protein